MIDPILSLSFSMHSNKGVYALLLGSGISRAAGIPTGWEVTLDLIKKLAKMKGVDLKSDPAKWYEETYAEEADYSKLLNYIAKTSSERSQLLKGYFEPTEEEREQKIKTPTEAHKSIARLVTNGYIKVIVTTNFDRLMEKALEEFGVIPIVISTPDAAIGAPPVVHSQCTLIKVHGDYLDTRLKNTPKELSTYDKRINNLLNRIFDEFGLVISGWSGEWDIALRNALQRSNSRRFSTYWTVKDNLSEKAKELAEFKNAEIIPIQSADAFFTELTEKLLAISEFERPHPLSAKAAVVTFKKYLEEEKYKIRLHDLLLQETERLFEGISPKVYPADQPKPDKDELLRRVTQHEANAEILQAMMIVGGYWGNQDVANLFVKSLERLVDHQKERGGYIAWVNLRLYPITILIFSAGLSALASNNYQMLAMLLLKPQNKYADRGKEPLILSVFPSAVIDQDVGRLLPNMDRRWTPTSDHLVDILASPLREYIPEQLEFENLFDRLEYLISLVVIDHNSQTTSYPWAPIGRYGWRLRHSGTHHITNLIQNEIDANGENWAPVKFGFFGSSIDRARSAQENLIKHLSQVHW